MLTNGNKCNYTYTLIHTFIIYVHFRSLNITKTNLFLEGYGSVFVITWCYIIYNKLMEDRTESSL